MSKQTPLYNKHLQAHAKMVDFSGWEMPLHYGSQLNEHHQVRKDAGVFDISHMTVIDLRGKQVREFLRWLLANDVSRLKNPGQALYSCMLNEQGKILDDLIVYYQQEEHFCMITNAATRQKDLTWITEHAKTFAVNIVERQEIAVLAVQGPKARERVKSLLPADLQAVALALAPFYCCWNEDFFVARTGYTGEDGFEIILPADQAPVFWESLLLNQIKPIGLGARDTLRLEAGLNLYGTDMDEQESPLESGLAWTVAWSPENRPFIGRKALLQQREQGEYSVLKGLILLEKGVLRHQQTVIVEGLGEGYITSGTFSPTLGQAIALARLPAGDYQQVTVMVRNKPLTARVVKPPFVRYGRICI